MKNYALFSTNGRFIGYTNFQPTTGLYKELPDNFDPITQVWAGDFATGSIKNVTELEIKDYRLANANKKWVVFETELNEKTGRIITEERGLGIYKQLNAIMDVLHENKDNLKLTPKFLEVYEEIQTVRRNHELSLKSYQEAPKADIVLKEDEKKYIEQYTQQHLNINDDPVDIEFTNKVSSN
jgi:hypothetical protein